MEQFNRASVFIFMRGETYEKVLIKNHFHSSVGLSLFHPCRSCHKLPIRTEHFRPHKSCRFPGHTCHHLIHIVRSCDRKHRPGEEAVRVIVMGNPLDRPPICLDGNLIDPDIFIRYVCRSLTLRNECHVSDPHRRVDGRRRDLPIYQIYQRQET